MTSSSVAVSSESAVAASVCTADRLGPMRGSLIGVGLVAAEGGRFTTMVVAFLVALVVVAPFGWKRLRPILRERRAVRRPAPSNTAGQHGNGTDAVVTPSPDDVGVVAARVDAVAAEWPDGSEVVDLEVPATLTVAGRPSPLGRQLVEDAARRAGLSTEWVGSTGDDVEVVLRLRRRG